MKIENLIGNNLYNIYKNYIDVESFDFVGDESFVCNHLGVIFDCMIVRHCNKYIKIKLLSTPRYIKDNFIYNEKSFLKNYKTNDEIWIGLNEAEHITIIDYAR